MEAQSAWYNFDSEEYDYMAHGPQTDGEALHYIPKGAARGLFILYRETGFSVSESMLKVLQACTGNTEAANA